jgi:hypothetical protein
MTDRRWQPQATRLAFESYRAQGRCAWVNAQGSSMRPLIAPGARLLVEFGATPGRVGEIILFAKGERIVAHRLVSWPAGGLPIAKGDFEPYADGPIDPNDIFGVVCALAAGPEATTSVACGGWPARAIAGISRQIGRAAARTRRAASLLQDPLRGVAIQAIAPLARVAALALFVPIIWAAHRTHSREFSRRRKEVIRDGEIRAPDGSRDIHCRRAG